MTINNKVNHQQSKAQLTQISKPTMKPIEMNQMLPPLQSKSKVTHTRRELCTVKPAQQQISDALGSNVVSRNPNVSSFKHKKDCEIVKFQFFF